MLELDSHSFLYSKQKKKKLAYQANPNPPVPDLLAFCMQAGFFLWKVIGIWQPEATV